MFPAVADIVAVAFSTLYVLAFWATTSRMILAAINRQIQKRLRKFQLVILTSRCSQRLLQHAQLLSCCSHVLYAWTHGLIIGGMLGDKHPVPLLCALALVFVCMSAAAWMYACAAVYIISTDVTYQLLVKAVKRQQPNTEQDMSCSVAAVGISEAVRTVTLVSSPYHWTFQMLWVVYWLTITALVLFTTWLLVIQPVHSAKQAAKVHDSQQRVGDC